MYLNSDVKCLENYSYGTSHDHVICLVRQTELLYLKSKHSEEKVLRKLRIAAVRDDPCEKGMIQDVDVLI